MPRMLLLLLLGMLSAARADQCFDWNAAGGECPANHSFDGNQNEAFCATFFSDDDDVEFKECATVCCAAATKCENWRSSGGECRKGDTFAETAAPSLCKADECPEMCCTTVFTSGQELRKAVGRWICCEDEEVFTAGTEACHEEFGTKQRYGNIADWKTSNIGDFSNMFNFEQRGSADPCDVTAAAWDGDGIRNWDTSSATTFGSMFRSAAGFNQDLNLWDTGNVEDFSNMFSGCASFNANLSSWQVGSGLNFASMFEGARLFTSNLTAWQTSAATNFNSMFKDAATFTSDLSKWITSKVKDMAHMFDGAASFETNLRRWDVAAVGNMAAMFRGATEFGSTWDLTGLNCWKPASLEEADAMFGVGEGARAQPCWASFYGNPPCSWSQLVTCHGPETAKFTLVFPGFFGSGFYDQDVQAEALNESASRVEAHLLNAATDAVEEVFAVSDAAVRYEARAPILSVSTRYFSTKPRGNSTEANAYADAAAIEFSMGAPSEGLDFTKEKVSEANSMALFSSVGTDSGEPFRRNYFTSMAAPERRLYYDGKDCFDLDGGRRNYIDYRAGTSVGNGGYCSGYMSIQDYFNSIKASGGPLFVEKPESLSCFAGDRGSTGGDVRVYFKNTCGEGLTCHADNSTAGRCQRPEGASNEELVEIDASRTVQPVIVLPPLADTLITEVTSETFVNVVRRAFNLLSTFTNFGDEVELILQVNDAPLAITNLLTGALDKTFTFASPTAFTVPIKVPKSAYTRTDGREVEERIPVFGFDAAYAFSKLVEIELVKQHGAKATFELHFPGFDGLQLYGQQFQLDVDINSKSASNNVYPSPDELISRTHANACAAINLPSNLGLNVGEHAESGSMDCLNHAWLRNAVVRSIEAVLPEKTKRRLMQRVYGSAWSATAYDVVQLVYANGPASTNAAAESPLAEMSLANRNADAAVAIVTLHGIFDEDVVANDVNKQALDLYFNPIAPDSELPRLYVDTKAREKIYRMKSFANNEIIGEDGETVESSICANLDNSCGGVRQGGTGTHAEAFSKACADGLACGVDIRDWVDASTRMYCMPECNRQCESAGVDGGFCCRDQLPGSACAQHQTNVVKHLDGACLEGCPRRKSRDFHVGSLSDISSDVTGADTTPATAPTTESTRFTCAPQCRSETNPRPTDVEEAFCVEGPIAGTSLDPAHLRCSLKMTMFLPAVISTPDESHASMPLSLFEMQVTTAFRSGALEVKHVNVSASSFGLVTFPNSFQGSRRGMVIVDVATSAANNQSQYIGRLLASAQANLTDLVATYFGTTTTSTTTKASTTKQSRFVDVIASINENGNEEGDMSSTATDNARVVAAVTAALEDVVADIGSKPLGTLEVGEVEYEMDALVVAVDTIMSALIAEGDVPKSDGNDNGGSTQSAKKTTSSTVINEIAALYAESLPLGETVTARGAFASVYLAGVDAAASFTVEEGQFDIGVSVKIPPLQDFEGSAAALSGGATAGIAIVLVNDTALFEEVDNSTAAGAASAVSRTPTSSVLSVKLGSGSLIGTRFKNNEKLTFSLRTDQLPSDRNAAHQHCGFYVPLDPKASLYAPTDFGRWINAGCSTLEHTDGTTVCECDHLTSFAVLIDTSGTNVSSKALDLISLVGAVLSAICLALIVVLYAFFEDARTTPKKVLLGLSSTLLVAMIMFVVAQQPEAGSNGCIAAAAVLHYFLLSAFCWMLCEGVQLYVDFVVLLGTKAHLRKMTAFAVVVPLVAVVVTLAVSPDLYGDRSGMCWIQDDAAFWAAFAGPAFAIMLANLVIFALVMKNIFKLEESADVKTKAKRGILASAMFFVLMGVAWIPVLVLYSENETVDVAIHYLFAVLNAFSGVWLFYLHCVKDEKLRSLLKRRFGSGGSSSLSFGKKRLVATSSGAPAKGTGTNHSGPSNTIPKDGTAHSSGGNARGDTYLSIADSRGGNSNLIAEEGDANSGVPRLYALASATAISPASRLSSGSISRASFSEGVSGDGGSIRSIRRTTSELNSITGEPRSIVRTMSDV